MFITINHTCIEVNEANGINKHCHSMMIIFIKALDLKVTQVVLEQKCKVQYLKYYFILMYLINLQYISSETFT